MNLVIGLGNPSNKYLNTRHNFGALVIDKLAFRNALKPKDDVKLAASWFKFWSDANSFIAAKPLTFMNESGLPTKNLLNYFKISTDNLIVIHDDLDLELGQIRVKKGSSSGGHLGIESIISHLGTRDFIRLRLGIGRPPGRKNPATFVLEQFKKNEINEVEFAVGQASDAIIELSRIGLEAIMNKYN